jgi:K(+)-stimulated pyrophosphate-energized sodium pump
MENVDLEKSTAADNRQVDTPNRQFTPIDINLGNVSLTGVNATGVESNLVTFIKSDKQVDKDTWFDFDRLTFETGQATLKSESREQLKNIAEILKAYPGVNIKIGGYTDNTGDANSNLKLSNDRAQSVKKELAGLGIDESRIEAEGYGQEFAVASNDTEEGRAQNRRISVRVTKK